MDATAPAIPLRTRYPRGRRQPAVRGRRVEPAREFAPFVAAGAGRGGSEQRLCAPSYAASAAAPAVAACGFLSFLSLEPRVGGEIPRSVRRSEERRVGKECR